MRAPRLVRLVPRSSLLALIAVAAIAIATARAVDWEYVSALDFSVVWQYRFTLLKGYGVTLYFAVAGAGLGMLLGTVLAMISQSRVRALRWLVAAHVEIWRNTPLLVQLVWIHFAFPSLTGINTTVAQSGLIGMTLNISAYYTEIVRAGVEAVPRGQWDAAHALGLPAPVRWQWVILPQALRIMVPPTANLLLSVFKATAILSVLTIGELMRETTRISNYTFKPVEMFTAAAVIYALSGLLISQLTMRVEHYLSKKEV